MATLDSSSLQQQPPLRWRTVGPHWCSVNKHHHHSHGTPCSSPVPANASIATMQQGVHSSFLNAISRPDLNREEFEHNFKHVCVGGAAESSCTTYSNTTINNEPNSPPSASSLVPSALGQAGGGQLNHGYHHAMRTHDQVYPTTQDLAMSPVSAHVNQQQQEGQQLQQLQQLQLHDPQRRQDLQGTSPYLLTEHQRQHQLYLQQLQLQQRLHAMPGSTTRPWYPTFGPAALSTTCSDNTILLDSPQQFTLINHARLNKPSVGPHWRSIPSAASSASPSPTPLPSSPRFPSFSRTGKVLSEENGTEQQEQHGYHHEHHYQQQQHYLDRTTVITSTFAGSEAAPTCEPSSPSGSASSPESSSSSLNLSMSASSPASSVTIGALGSFSSSPPFFFQMQQQQQHESEMDMGEARNSNTSSPNQRHCEDLSQPQHQPHQHRYQHGQHQQQVQQLQGSQRTHVAPALTRYCPQQTAHSHPNRTMKRKATWQDEGPLEASDRTPQSSISFSALSVSSSGNSIYPALSKTMPIPLIEQFHPMISANQGHARVSLLSSDHNMVFKDVERQDDEPMATTPTPAESSSGQMSVDVSAANNVDHDGFEDDDVVGHGGVGKGGPFCLTLKRIRPRLDLRTDCRDAEVSELESRRQESGQKALDIFQECFYNAAAASR